MTTTPVPDTTVLTQHPMTLPEARGPFTAALLTALRDGAPAGQYDVTITWGVDGRDDEDRLNGRYREPGQSKLTATVKEGPNEIPPFKLRK